MLEALSRNRQEIIKTWQEAAKNNQDFVTNRLAVPKIQQDANQKQSRRYQKLPRCNAAYSDIWKHGKNLSFFSAAASSLAYDFITQLK